MPQTLKPSNSLTLQLLKKGWRWVRLGEVCKIIMGQSPPGYTYNKEGRGLPFFQGKIDFGKIYPTPSAWCTEPKKIAEPNDILISVRAPVGPTNICKEQCCIGRGLAAIRATDGIEPLFIFHFLHLIENEIMEIGRGSTFGAIKREDIKNIAIPLPPLSEQRRIAIKIQELMQEVEYARTACEKQLEVAKALPSAYLREVFESKGAKKWERKRLGEVCEFQKGRKPQTLYEQQKKNYLPYILIESFDGIYKKFTDDDGCPKCVKEDVLLVWDGARSGLCAIGLEGYIGSTVSALKAKQGVFPHYLYWFIRFHYEDLNRNVRGTGIPHLEKEYVHSLPIPLPSISVQRRIASELKEKMAYAENLQSAIRNQQSTLEALPQAILRKAFRGKL